MIEQNKNEITTIQQNTAVDLSAFSGFSAADITASSIILIQGDNKLKDELGVKNGQFVADNMSFGTEFIFQPILSSALMDVFKSDPTVEGGAPKDDYIKTIKETDSILSEDGRLVELDPVNEMEQHPLVFRGNDGFYYQRKKILVMAINGMPYRMTFKSRAKHMAFKDVSQSFLKVSKFQGFKDPIEGIYKMFSKEMQGARGKYISLAVSFIRAATDDELAAIAPFRTIDVMKIKESNVDENVPY